MKTALFGAAGLIVCLVLAWLILAMPGHAQAQDGDAGSTASAGSGGSLGDMVGSDLQPINSTKALTVAEQSVVRVLVVYRGYGGQPLDTVGMGSGFVVAPGYIVTNYHVVEVPPEASSADIYIVPHKDSGATYQQVQLVKPWVEGDLALLAAPNLKIAPLKLYLTPYKNERVVAMGYPDVTDHLLNRSGTALLEPGDAYVTQGSIALFASSNPDGSRVDTLFHTAPINHGNSGGPLLNECGQVVGVNTWTAPSTLSAGGDLDVAAGQFVATHVSALNTFLASAGVTPQIVSTPCYARTEDEIVKDDALTKALAAAAAAQAQRLDEQKKAEADRAVMERLQLGAMVILSLLVLVLIALIVRREMRHRAEIHASREPEAPTAFSGDTPEKPRPEKTKPVKAEKVKPEKTAPEKTALERIRRAPLRHPVPWGWIILGLIIVVAVAAFLIKDRDIYNHLPKAKPAVAVAKDTAVHMVCAVDKAASPNALPGAGPIEFEFDAAHACVNDRTPYERQPDGTLVRFTLADSDPVAARMELSADGTVFRRFDYRLDPAAYKTFLDQRTALGSLRCSAHDDPGALVALSENLAKVRALSQSYLTMPPETSTVWSCHKVANGG
ncbi:serine protease [Asticcacaulis sp. EMRT-3]|uniref:S1C family serine protease n=1 Tax=Asticcacaulis sp. EMRT-3 TaxID=3040349 RepID=UPI0024AED39F|nr:serine protease [Asticcacaulis sp. EMRT-3]MDI7776119.1 serine protease [Asticcacaulis sp. EMRT-3]